MITVKFKYVEYPVRTFLVLESDGAETQRTVSVQSLSDAMGDEKEEHGTYANEIDCEIYFYLADDNIKLSAEEICEKHLDEPMTFIEELF